MKARFCFLLLTATVFGSATASAQASDLERQEAIQRFDEGNKLYAAGRYEEARIKFKQAWSNLQRPNVLFNFARAERLSGHLVEAARHYRAYLHLVDPKITAADRKEVQDRLTELGTRLGRVTVTASQGTQVTIDSERIDEALVAEPIEVTTGVHKISGALGERKKEVDVMLSAGETKDVDLSPDRPTAAEPTLAPAVAPVHTDDPPPETAHASPARWIVPVGLGAVAVGALAMGIGFASGNRSAVDRADRLRGEAGGRPCADASSAACTAYSDALSTGTTDKTWSYVGYVGAGVFAAGALAAIVLWPRPSAATRGQTRVVPSIGPHAAALQFHVGF